MGSDNLLQKKKKAIKVWEARRILWYNKVRSFFLSFPFPFFVPCLISFFCLVLLFVRYGDRSKGERRRKAYNNITRAKRGGESYQSNRLGMGAGAGAGPGPDGMGWMDTAYIMFLYIYIYMHTQTLATTPRHSRPTIATFVRNRVRA